MLVARANSRGELAPNCRIVGTEVADGGRVKSCEVLEFGKGVREEVRTAVPREDASVKFFGQYL